MLGKKLFFEFWKSARENMFSHFLNEINDEIEIMNRAKSSTQHLVCAVEMIRVCQNYLGSGF